MSTPVPKRNQVSPFLVFFLVNAMQIGVGVLGFPTYVASELGADGWIAVILSGIIITVTIFLIFSILKKGGGDILQIHCRLFGKVIGNALTFLLIVYLLGIVLVILRTFIEVIQVWIFPDLETWAPSAVYLLLAYYAVVTGFRAVTGVCFFGVILSLFTYFSLIGPIEFFKFRNILPLVTHGPQEFLAGIKTMTLSYLGIGMIFFLYPFISRPHKAVSWAIGANVLTIFMYLFVAFAALFYFSPAQLEKTIWPLLTMWQIIQLPFVERFEFLAIPVWGLVVLPNICLGLWTTSRGLRLLFKVRQHQVLILLCLMIFCSSVVLETREQIEQLNTIVSEIGFYFAIVYVPLLWMMQFIRKGGQSHDQSV
ncbi:spore gernimation protein GerB [Alteribacter lacisalsi]|uniref:Spore gernimation protein GerB n=1 Tax=Alteribacter lacisalsi TaxID=2045244 RepID=A0A2W0HDY6_9BACI|nr:GerAB/ArcD/ProY family transporter [Alteribacter lacisalsi]PYZ98210.1 spore gernimation protein GerB [Alteribacter lacisalsi]